MSLWENNNSTFAWTAYHHTDVGYFGYSLHKESNSPV